MDKYRLPFDSTLVAQVRAKHPTPFYLYHEEGITQRVADLCRAFSWSEGFREYFAVKATPNPHIIALLAAHGCGTDCSSVAELEISRRLGIRGEAVMFTSNNTTDAEFRVALGLGAIINLDAPHHLRQLKELDRLPQTISFRYNPGPAATGNAIIGNPKESKFGCTRDQLLQGYSESRALGISHFGLHAMVVSNELRPDALLATAEMLFELAVEVKNRTGAQIEFVNLGGGIGVPYEPSQRPVDLAAYGQGVQSLYEKIIVPSGLAPMRISMENGRAITGPSGFLVTQVLNVKETYKKYVGVDATMANLMRPGMYGAYHHISVLGKEKAASDGVVDVVGSLCENNDKFAINRELPDVSVGDILVIHDAGAHGYAMGFQYNGRLRCAELLFNNDGRFRLIRRAETLDDLFATLEFPNPPGDGNGT